MMIAGTAQAWPALEATTMSAPEKAPVTEIAVLVIAAKCAERPPPRQVHVTTGRAAPSHWDGTSEE